MDHYNIYTFCEIILVNFKVLYCCKYRNCQIVHLKMTSVYGVCIVRNVCQLKKFKT